MDKKFDNLSWVGPIRKAKAVCAALNLSKVKAKSCGLSVESPTLSFLPPFLPPSLQEQLEERIKTLEIQMISISMATKDMR